MFCVHVCVDGLLVVYFLHIHYVDLPKQYQWLESFQERSGCASLYNVFLYLFTGSVNPIKQGVIIYNSYLGTLQVETSE